MILNIDLNPRMNLNFKTKKININLDNPKGNFSHTPGGEAFLISRLLRIFSEDVLMTGFIGGLWKSEYLKGLEDNDIKYDYILIKDEIGTDLYLEDQLDNRLLVKEEYRKIVSEEVIEFHNNFEKLSSQSSLIIGSGDFSKDIGRIIYYNLIKISEGKKFIINIKGQELKEALKAGPYMVVLDKESLEAYVKLILVNRENLVNASNYILSDRTKIVVINLGDSYLYVDESGDYLVKYRDNTKWSVNNIGLVAGLAIGVNRNYSREMTLKLGEAYNHIIREGLDIEKIDLVDIKSYMNKVEIS